jgi:aryl-alcohol dehydrogenase-like predicted oxidoreductase
MTDDSFKRRHVPALRRSVFRLGLACNYGIDATGFERAHEAGMDYVFWTSRRTAHLREPLRNALRRRRETLTIATGPSIGYFAGNVRRGTENLLRSLGVEYIDALHLFWLGVGSAWTPGTIDALAKLKEEGKIRAIAISIHDRPRAGALLADSPIDLFMIRYNAAHPGAESDIFPHRPQPAANRAPGIVAYTATSWRRLLKRPRGWSGPVMSAGDCYRFCLSNPHVDLTLAGPKNWEQLQESLSAIDRGPLSPDEERWMRDFGRAVHG